MSTSERYKTFSEFYRFYLSEHENTVSRRLHFTGTSMALALILIAIGSGIWCLLLVAPLQGYLLAWIGHFFFEHNKPATFKYPLFSFMGDWRLWWEIVTGKRAL
jgi:Predicted membrane protein